MSKKSAIIIIILVGVVVYFNSLNNAFIWDDEEQIVNNVMIHSLSGVRGIFSGSTFNSGGAGSLTGIYYKPIMMVVFNVLYVLFGPRPVFFHLFQIGLHIVNSVLVFYFFRLFFKRLMLSLGLSLIFLVHPIQSEAVVYISALQEILFFFFGMSGFLAVTSRRQTDNLYRTSLGFAFLFLSILSKETGGLFLVLTLVYGFLYRGDWSIKRRRSMVIFVIFYGFFYGLLRFVLAGVDFEKIGIAPISRASTLVRLMTAPAIFTHYLKTFFFPKDLAILQHWVVMNATSVGFYLPLFLGSISLLIPSLILLKTKGYRFFLVWFIFGVGLHLQIIPLDMTVADRWFYFPMVGLLGVIGLLISKKSLLPLFLIILIFSARTVIRNNDWKNGLTLYRHDARISRDAFDLENNLGVELFRDGEISQAKNHFKKSVTLAPYWWTNWNNLGAAHEKEGDISGAEKYYKRAIDNGDYHIAYENYAGLLFRQKKFSQLKEFLRSRALLKFPFNSKLQEINQYLYNM